MVVEETNWSKQKPKEAKWRHQIGFKSNGPTGTKDTDTQTTMVRACRARG